MRNQASLGWEFAVCRVWQVLMLCRIQVVATLLCTCCSLDESLFTSTHAQKRLGEKLKSAREEKNVVAAQLAAQVAEVGSYCTEGGPMVWIALVDVTSLATCGLRTWS